MSANAAQLPSLPTSTPPRRFPPGTQLGWLVRYVPIKHLLTGPAMSSLLEVGSGARGVGSIVDDPFVGIDLRIDGPPAPGMYPFSYDGGRLPFRSDSFHTVVSMATLEHVPPANRVDFLNELLRVSASRVILGFPTDSGQPPKGEDFMRDLFVRLGMAAPPWLNEHDEFGLPPARDVEAILSQLDGWTWRPLRAAGDFLNLLTVLADIIPGTAPILRPVLENHAAELESWILSGTFGPAYDSKLYLIERRDPTLPLVDLADPASLLRCITCPDCEGAIEAVPPTLRCHGCGTCFRPDANGVLAMHRTARARPASKPPGLTFALTPDCGSRDWLVPVHNYLHAFAASAPHRLWLTVGPRDKVATVLDTVMPAVRTFGDQPFPEIYISETPPEPGAAVPLSTERARLGEYTSEWFRAQADTAARPRPEAAAGGVKTYW